MWNRNEDTICAVSTPHGVGGISVIRVSGKKALSICKNLSKVLNNKVSFESHKAYFSVIHDETGHKIDEAVFTYFAHLKSFTGEEVVEISCHGSPFITQQILDLLVRNGCRIADKGEFTFRAFMNGQLDLIEAESVLSLIESQNKASATLALRQLDGHVSKQFNFLISDLTWCLAHIEASIDFSEQGVETVDADILIQKLRMISSSLQKLFESYESGKLIKDGVKLVLIGEPNVGKSSLLNELVQNEKAIVTPIAGTTRDVIEVETTYNGIKYSLSDTAGLRETDNEIEIIGIDRSKKEAEKADILGFVLDCSNNDWARVLHLVKVHSDKKRILIFNKSDLISKHQQSLIKNKFENQELVVFTSTTNSNCRDIIFSAVTELISDFSYRDEVIISSSRQYEHSLFAYNTILICISELESGIGFEFVSLHLKEALISLQKILGLVYDDQIIDRVFSEFCLGK